jgi:hypothetical protein
MGRTNSKHRNNKKCTQTSVDRKPEGKKPLLRPRHRREDSIKMDLDQVGQEGMAWINVLPNSNRWTQS